MRKKEQSRVFFSGCVELEDLKPVEKMRALLIVKLVGQGVEYHFTAIILQDAACLVWLCFALSLHRQEFQCKATLSVKHADDGYAGRSCT